MMKKNNRTNKIRALDRIAEMMLSRWTTVSVRFRLAILAGTGVGSVYRWCMSARARVGGARFGEPEERARGPYNGNVFSSNVLFVMSLMEESANAELQGPCCTR